MSESERPTVSILGPGAVGSALLEGLQLADYPVKSVFSRSATVQGNDTDRFRKRSDLNRDLLFTPDTLKRPLLGELLFLTVPDDQIVPVAKTLAGRVDDWSGIGVVHCSGLLTSEELNPLALAGAATCSFHPIQTFISGSGCERFSGITISVEGDRELSGKLSEVASRLNATALHVGKEEKSVLHLAAVFLSNYLVCLARVSDELIRNALPDADVHLLRPLLEQTAANLADRSPQEVLTGPISRGDSNSVSRHLDMLSGRDAYKTLYKELGQVALAMAEEQERVTEKQVQKLRGLLERS